ncbi:MAG: protein translocase subunit SecD [Eubacterium sp.]|nr:protein translocase subunit SecD [Candidatus Colimonas fimequi]
MKSKSKVFFAIFFAVVVIVGWYGTIFGIGGLEPLKDRMKLGLDVKGGVYVVMEADKTDLTGDELRKAMEQTQAVIEERVNQMGLSEPVVTIEGEKRIRVELPGAEDAEQAIEQIGKTAQLKFALADGTFVLDGSNVKDAQAAQDNDSAGYAVNLEFDSEGADKFLDATTKAYSGAVKSTVEGVEDNAIMIILDDEIISAPGVRNGPIAGGRCEITGNFDKEEAQNLAALIRGGSLPLELTEITSSVQSAKIGYNALEKSVYAGIIGLILILLLMLVAYRMLGFAADIALMLYVLLLLNIMSAMGSVLTLPGMAGIILSVGMAVDANVIIFSRIREEMANGKTVRVATQEGAKRAMKTIFDSQVTTLIAAVILYEIGTSAVRGFAFTFMLGIVIGIFTALVVTQLYVGLIANSDKFGKKKFFGVKEDGTTTFQIKKELHFIKYRKQFFALSLAIILLGAGFTAVKGLNYGIDFTGGTMIQMDMGKQVEISDVEKSIADFNLDPEIIYSGADNKEIVIRTITDLDNSARAEVIDKINADFGTTDENVIAQELFGPSIGKELRNNAILAIIIAALCMLVYIRIRFRNWKYGEASLLGILHDVLIVVAFYAIFGVTVNNPFIAGVLTVVGYSINDTIVIFDRVRENSRYARKQDIEHTLDKSITQTIGRSLMTSATTLIVMVPLAAMGGATIREFVLPLMVGVLAGAYSSIAMCSPIYYLLNKPGQLSKYEKQVEANMKHNKKNKKSKKKAEDLDADLSATDEEIDAVMQKEIDARIAEAKAALEAEAAAKAAEEKGEATAEAVEEVAKPAPKKTNEKRSKRYVKGNKK